MTQNFEIDENTINDFLTEMARYWWVFLLRGIAAIIFGFLAFIWPGLTVIVLTMFWGAYVMFDGAMALWAGILGDGATRSQRWWLAALGALGLLAGVIALFSPASTALVFMLFIGGWAVAIGLLQIIGAIRLRKEIEGEWYLAGSGVLSILFGLIFLFQPSAGAVSVAWMIGIASIFFGGLLVALAFKLKKEGAA